MFYAGLEDRSEPTRRRCVYLLHMRVLSSSFSLHIRVLSLSLSLCTCVFSLSLSLSHSLTHAHTHSLTDSHVHGECSWTGRSRRHNDCPESAHDGLGGRLPPRRRQLLWLQVLRWVAPGSLRVMLVLSFSSSLSPSLLPVLSVPLSDPPAAAAAAAPAHYQSKTRKRD